MAEEAPRSRLGRGLAALIGDAGDENTAIERARGQRRVPVEFLRPNPRNPRRHFNDMELDELSTSIRAKGILQPILVRAVSGAPDAYEIIAGERRWRAAQRAGLHDVPVLLLEIGDKEALEIAIIENVQRADLNPLEEAMGYDSLIEQFSYTQADLAKIVGKSRSHIANTLRLMKLPESVKRYLAEGKLTAGHARALLASDNPEALARQIIEKGLNVRDVEALAGAQAEAKGKTAKRRPRGAKSADVRALERKLSDILGLQVEINHRASGGDLRIRYRTLEQLDAVCRKLGVRH
ncbi:MAG TPA: ParB/RepB/Spo0J family partition protein [Xanthobacteraceae bacterium]|nr:ParB/RepB/Spo0J family partition protein [Xanthobacteraceae bacterium]